MSCRDPTFREPSGASLDSKQTYKIAHTAQCKLRMSAKHADRNLRFVLGHAFTLDNLMLRIVEIEDEEKIAAAKNQAGAEPGARRVSFQDNSNRPTGELRSGIAATEQTTRKNARAASPPPTQMPHDSDTDSDDYDDDDDDDDDEGLGLSLTTSHIARPPPNLIADDADEDEDDGPISPPWTPSDSMLGTIVEEEGDEELQGLYDNIRQCGCQRHVEGEKAPAIEQIWEVPADKLGHELGAGRRAAVVKLRA